MDTITMKEMLNEMDTGRPFSVSFVTYDKQRKTGGKIRMIREAVINAQPKSTDKKSGKSKPPDQRVRVDRRNPHHYDHSTRSIRLVVNGCKTSTIKKLHIFLVLTFNERKLIL
jgi:hypothetical protein